MSDTPVPSNAERIPRSAIDLSKLVTQTTEKLLREAGIRLSDSVTTEVTPPPKKPGNDRQK